MRKLLLFLTTIIVFACTPTRLLTNNGKGNTMIKNMDGLFSALQFDSMCVADTLPTDLSEWDSIPLKDAETGSRYTLYYLYVSKDSTETTYKVEKTVNDSVKIIKRVIK